MLGAKLDVSAYLDRLNSETARLDQGAIQRWADLIYGAWQDGKFVYIIGNGGSGCNASPKRCLDLSPGRRPLTRWQHTIDKHWNHQHNIPVGSTLADRRRPDARRFRSGRV